MKLTLYKISDAKNIVNKTLGSGVEIDIVLKRGVNLIAPELILKNIPSVNMNDFNYCHIEGLNRYYFIDTIESMNNQFWKLLCSCDVLETYKEDVFNSESKYSIEAVKGDYGAISVDTSVTTVENIYSDLNVKLDRSIILSTVEI